MDNNVSIAEMEQAFRSMVRTKRFSRWTDLLLVSVGNAAFCRLFNGDLWAMLTVFAATMLGFLAKQQLTRLKYNPLGVIILSAFTASMAAACAVLFQIGSTPQIAMAASVLFLVPGDQLHHGPDARPHPDGHFPRRPLHHDDCLHRHRPFRNHAHRRGKQLMNPDLISSILLDGLMAAIAATGFAVISNPPRRAIAVSAVLAAVGHAFRFYMLHSWTIDISSATFIAAFTIGMLGVMTAKLVKCPAEIFAFPSLLPMIPGVYAYKTILALMQFMQENQDAAVMNRLIVDICKNGITAFFIIFSLVIGVAIPMLMFKRLSYTRIIKPGH